MRYLQPALSRDLEKKMVMLAGPRQCGKSTLAKALAGTQGAYLNWDVRSHQQVIRGIAWPKNASLVVLDELHKFPKWKNFLKGVVDEYGNKPPLLITGSAKLETFRRQGDALTGRFFHYRLHPFDVSETKYFSPASPATERLEKLLDTGGFPEAYLNPVEALRLRNDRFDLVLQEDLRDLSKTNALRSLSLLVELLRERVGGQVSYASLATDLSVSAPTVKAWIELLERLFVVFVVSPYSGKIARGLKKEPKIYFYDCAAAHEVNADIAAARLENAVACALLKHCHYQRDTLGEAWELRYFRDREKREVDFVVLRNRRPYWCIEVKRSDTSLSPALRYIHERMRPTSSFQLVQRSTSRQERDGCRVVPAAEWLDALGP